MAFSVQSAKESLEIQEFPGRFSESLNKSKIL